MLYACNVNEYLNPLYQLSSGHDLSLIRDMDMVGQPGSADGDQLGPSARQEFHIMINLMSLRWDTLYSVVIRYFLDPFDPPPIRRNENEAKMQTADRGRNRGITAPDECNKIQI